MIPKVHARLRDQHHSLVIVDPTYKLLGAADENSAKDITALLAAIEHLAVSTGAAVGMASHFAKGNAAGKENIDRISGSGVFARDPDSLITFTKHEEDAAFAVEFVLRNLPPAPPFVVKWEWPLFHRAENLDPTKLKQGGRPPTHQPETVLKCLGERRLTTPEWRDRAARENGVSKTRFYAIIKQLEQERKVAQSEIDEKWEQIRQVSRNWYGQKINKDGLCPIFPKSRNWVSGKPR